MNHRHAADVAFTSTIDSRAGETVTSEKTQKAMDNFHAFAKDIAVWLVTAVCASLAYSSWQTAIAVERLVVEVTFIAKTNDASDKRIEANANDISTIRSEQRKRTQDVYQVADIERRLKATESHLSAVRGSRWTLRDQQQWVEGTMQNNPDWKPAPVYARDN